MTHSINGLYAGCSPLSKCVKLLRQSWQKRSVRSTMAMTFAYRIVAAHAWQMGATSAKKLPMQAPRVPSASSRLPSSRTSSLRRSSASGFSPGALPALTVTPAPVNTLVPPAAVPAMRHRRSISRDPRDGDGSILDRNSRPGSPTGASAGAHCVGHPQKPFVFLLQNMHMQGLQYTIRSWHLCHPPSHLLAVRRLHQTLSSSSKGHWWHLGGYQ